MLLVLMEKTILQWGVGGTQRQVFNADCEWPVVFGVNHRVRTTHAARWWEWWSCTSRFVDGMWYWYVWEWSLEISSMTVGCSAQWSFPRTLDNLIMVIWGRRTLSQHFRCLTERWTWVRWCRRCMAARFATTTRTSWMWPWWPSTNRRLTSWSWLDGFRMVIVMIVKQELRFVWWSVGLLWVCYKDLRGRR